MSLKCVTLWVIMNMIYSNGRLEKVETFYSFGLSTILLIIKARVSLFSFVGAKVKHISMFSASRHAWISDGACMLRQIPRIHFVVNAEKTSQNINRNKMSYFANKVSENKLLPHRRH